MRFGALDTHPKLIQHASGRDEDSTILEISSYFFFQSHIELTKTPKHQTKPTPKHCPPKTPKQRHF